MMSERKANPATNVFAFDDSGKKYNATEFGARRQERMGSMVRGIASPPPTQFIQIPQYAHMLSADDVVRSMRQERRSLGMLTSMVCKKVVELLVSAWVVLDRWFFRARLNLAKLRVRFKDGVRRRRANLDDFWTYDLTEIAETPPSFTPKRRTPSVV
jgi:hypothetical protein